MNLLFIIIDVIEIIISVDRCRRRAVYHPAVAHHGRARAEVRLRAVVAPRASRTACERGECGRMMAADGGSRSSREKRAAAAPRLRPSVGRNRGSRAQWQRSCMGIGGTGSAVAWQPRTGGDRAWVGRAQAIVKRGHEPSQRSLMGRGSPPAAAATVRWQQPRPTVRTVCSMITDFMLTFLAHLPIDEEPSWDVESVDEDGDFGGIPASTDAVKELAVVKYERGGDVREESCIICFEEFDEGMEVTRMPCKHAFHGGCLTRWLESSHVCPLCRHAIPTSTDP
ncbi:uncharacterized protein LOC135641443 [Musa acuminata AAA Group]|uniref:uncharacterized protein LOC135641443 n=1 Tax=Musa acuminata AAA Group TaxID=214697 RepID=UPI0031DD0311